MSDERVERGMRRQLELRARLLDEGAEALGWKVGINAPAVQEQLGLDAPVAGFLTTATLVAGGGEYPLPAGVESLSVEPEVGVEIGPDGASIAALLPALELVRFDRPLDQLEDVLAEDIYHRGVVLGPRIDAAALGAARVLVNGDERHLLDPTAEAGQLERMVAAMTHRLADAGERLRPGELVITGTLVPPIEVRAGDRVRLELEPAGAVELGFTA
jgi:2-keto-4-pentenoate hydratase